MIEMLELVEDIPGIDYNAPDTEGNTPLHYAAQAGHVEVVTFLLNKVPQWKAKQTLSKHKSYDPIIPLTLPLCPWAKNLQGKPCHPYLGKCTQSSY